MTLKIGESSQFLTNRTNISNTPERVLVTLSGVNASHEEEASALLKALGFTQADLDAFKEKYGKVLKKFFADEFAKQPSRVTRDASSKPGFQAYIGINSRNYKLLTAFIAERRGTKTDHLKNQPNETATEKRIYDNSTLQAKKLRDLAEKAGVQTTSIGNPNRLDELRHFSVTIPNGTKTSDADVVLTALIEREFGDRITFAENRNQILNIAKQSGVTTKNISINGNRAEFDLTLEDTLKLKIAYNHIKDGLNRADAARLDVVNNNMFSQFVAGMFEGAKDSVAGTANIILDPVGTAKALWQVIGSPIETYNALYAELEKSWDKFQAADYVERSRMMGHLVGSVVTGIILGKGAGELGNILKATKTGAAIIEKAEKLKSAAVVKITEQFSDEAAALAKQRFSQRLKELGLSPNSFTNLAADPELWAQIGKIAGNKLKNGAIKFSNFSKQMIDEVGEKVKPHLEKLYREQLVELNLSDKADEIGIAKSKLSKLSDAELKANLDPTIRKGETLTQAKQRIKSAEQERYLRGYISSAESLGENPNKFNISRNDLNYITGYNAHTDIRHSPKITLEKSSAPSGTRTIEGRIYGDPPWSKAENFSYKWLDESTMNRTINEYLEKNWEQIRWELATKQRIDIRFDAGKAIGEGYFNKNIGTNNPPQAVYSKTSYVRIFIRLDQNEPMKPVIITAHPLGKGEIK